LTKFLWNYACLTLDFTCVLWTDGITKLQCIKTPLSFPIQIVLLSATCLSLTNYLPVLGLQSAEWSTIGQYWSARSSKELTCDGNQTTLETQKLRHTSWTCTDLRNVQKRFFFFLIKLLLAIGWCFVALSWSIKLSSFLHFESRFGLAVRFLVKLDRPVLPGPSCNNLVTV